MNMDLSATESRLRVLLELVDQQRERRCQEMISQARQEAATLVDQAKKEARNRVKQAAREAKRQGEHALNNAKAHLDTARRQRHLQQLAFLLVAGRQQLHQALLERWQNEQHRRQWINSLAQRAEMVLPAGALTITHPLDWSLEEWPVSARFAPVASVADATMAAGLLVCRGGTCVDGTLHGLTGDNARVDAQLLALMEHLSPSNPRGDLP